MTDITRHDFDTSGVGDQGADTFYTASQWGPNPTAPAIVATNGLAGSGSFLRIVHDTINDNVNRVSFNRTQVGPSPRVTADFDFRFSSIDQYADGMAFVLLPTSIYGASGQGSDGSYASEEPNIMGAFAVGFDLYPNENDVSIHWNGAEIQNANVLPGQLTLNSATWHHAHIVLEEDDGGSRATVTLTPNVSGTPGTPITPINNVFIPGLTPYENRVEFSARTGGLNLSADIDNLVVEHETSQTEIQYESFNLNSFTDLLVPGENVLAIHALNISAGDKDVLAVPQLQATTLSPIDVGSGGQYFISPTPTTTNGLGVVNPPSGPVGYSRDSGTFSDPFTLEISAEPGSTIYYTLNGTVPSTRAARSARRLAGTTWRSMRRSRISRPTCRLSSSTRLESAARIRSI
jgi:hypothetical protein